MIEHEHHRGINKYTGLLDRMAHRKWRATKQQPSKARSGHQLSCCSLSLHFLVRHPIQSPCTTKLPPSPICTHHRFSVHSAKACQTDRRTCELECCDITLRSLSSIAGLAIGQKTEKHRRFEVSFAIIAVRVRPRPSAVRPSAVRVRPSARSVFAAISVASLAPPSFVRRPSDRHSAAAAAAAAVEEDEEEEEEDLADQPSV